MVRLTSAVIFFSPHFHTTQHASYRISQRARMRTEQIFGWLKSVGAIGKSRVIRIAHTQTPACLAVSVYILLRSARPVLTGMW